MDRILAFLRAAGPGRLAAALGITGLVAAALFTLMFRMGAEPRALLYADLQPEDAAAVTTQLDSANIEYQVSADGTAVYVPRSKVADARMQLAAEGVPGNGSVGYEIFDKQDALGATSFVQNINKLRALEGELARTINALDTVRDARVHLVIPEKSVFEETSTTPTASIVVGLERGRLSGQQVQAIRNLVASAVPDLSADKISLLDERGELLAGAETGNAVSGALDDRRAQYEERVRQRIQALVEGLTGPGAVRVQVSADMDLAQVSQTEESFDPDKVAPRSTRTVEETSADRSGDQAVTQGANVPDGTNTNATGGQGSNSNRTDNTVNYEISRTTRTSVTAPGKVTRLSVAVAVDGTTTPAQGKAQPGWTPRTAEEMERITALVRSAAGISDERGDSVEVVNVRFAHAALDDGAAAPNPFAFDKADIMRAVEILSMLLIGLALVFFVGRPLVKGLVTDAGGGMLSGGGQVAGLALPGGAALGANNSIALPSSEGADGADMGIEIARIEGTVNANALKQVSSVVVDNPEQTVSVIRSWLTERR